MLPVLLLKYQVAFERTLEVTGTVMSGARLENITNLAEKEVRSPGKSDTVIVMEGANDISKNEAN